jgi:hypothetical protein
MLCLDSGTNIAHAFPGTREKAGHEEARCGNCGRWVEVVNRLGPNAGRVLKRHGDRQPCPLCLSRSPRHHARDH